MVESIRNATRALVALSRVVERACSDVTLTQYRVLNLVSSGDERATELAGHLALSKPSITAAVDGLVSKGLLTRRTHEADRRAIHVELTKAGRVVMRKTEAAIGAAVQRILDGLLEDPAAALEPLALLGQRFDEVMDRQVADWRKGQTVGQTSS